MVVNGEPRALFIPVLFPYKMRIIHISVCWPLILADGFLVGQHSISLVILTFESQSDMKLCLIPNTYPRLPLSYISNLIVFLWRWLH